MSTRPALCTYFSFNRQELLSEIRSAYLMAAADSPIGPLKASGTGVSRAPGPVAALVVPHGAACTVVYVCCHCPSHSCSPKPQTGDGFVVAAAAYRRLNSFLKSRSCTHLTAVILGTEHRGTTPVATSNQDWQTPLGLAPVDKEAVKYLSDRFGIPVVEKVHASEHSIENQLPFLQHGAQHNWDLTAAGCERDSGQVVATRAHTDSKSLQDTEHLPKQQPTPAAGLSIVPISIGFLGNQLHMISNFGAAVQALLSYKQQHCSQQQHGAFCPLPQSGCPRSDGDGIAAQVTRVQGIHVNSCCRDEVVLIVTSDFSHAGPWYRELPPPGVCLTDYMTAQDTPVLQAIQQGSVDRLLSAAATTHNSMCGLYPLAIALEALYSSFSSTESSSHMRLEAAANQGPQQGSREVINHSKARHQLVDKPELLDYRPAHTIFYRPDSTGFAAFVMYNLCC